MMYIKWLQTTTNHFLSRDQKFSSALSGQTRPLARPIGLGKQCPSNKSIKNDKAIRLSFFFFETQVEKKECLKSVCTSSKMEGEDWAQYQALQQAINMHVEA